MKWRTDEMLPVGDGHVLCVRSFGNPNGVPVLFLHGGPGSGVQESHLRLFDPKTCHVIAFDQRGAGRSIPRGALTANTTQHLIADIERIRTHFGIARWMLVGGSWGATLGLAYAETHPEAVLGLVLRAAFLGTRAEIAWAFGAGMQAFHPGLHEDFLGFLPAGERSRPLEHYWRRILDPDPAIHLPAAAAWLETERILSVLHPRQSRLDLAAIGKRTPPMPVSPLIEAHYFSQDCFLAARPILPAAPRLGTIPAVLVQGRYDLLCPPGTAHALAAAWPGARLVIVEAAGHLLEHDAMGQAVKTEVAAMAAGFAAEAAG